jgi:hypothetical protein
LLEFNSWTEFSRSYRNCVTVPPMVVFIPDVNCQNNPRCRAYLIYRADKVFDGF